MADADAQRQAATMITSIINRTQALWKAVLVQRRYMQMQEGCWVLQDWARALQLRARFRATQRAARTLQRAARGMFGRAEVRKLRTVNMVADELWRLKTVRERELLQLAKLNATARLEDSMFI